MNKKIIFRADGNNKIGLGHLSRLFALAEMYKEEYDFIFLTKENSQIKIIPQKYSIVIIPNNIIFDEEPDWIADKYPASEYILILDGYQFNSAYQKKIKQYGYFLMYVDDLVQEHMYADIVVNHSPHAKTEDYKAESYTKFALGTDYAMLRPAFLEEARKDRKIEKIDTAFVCFGGSDIHDLTLKATKALLAFADFKEINIVLGDAYNHTEIYKIKNERLKTYKNLDEKSILNLMKHCNFAVAPASTILYELCCVKMPVLSGYYVDNQKEAAIFFNENKLVYSLKNSNLKNINFNEELPNCLNEDFTNMLFYQKHYFDRNQKDRFIRLLKK